jgi:protein-tyrosine phosphatase
VWLGRIPSREERRAIVDVCAEIPSLATAAPRTVVPVLDLTVPDRESLRRAAEAIEAARAGGDVLVCCALGYSRSAAAVAAWLLMTHRAESVEAATAIVRTARPRVVLSPEHLAMLGA